VRAERQRRDLEGTPAVVEGEHAHRPRLVRRCDRLSGGCGAIQAFAPDTVRRHDLGLVKLRAAERVERYERTSGIDDVTEELRVLADERGKALCLRRFDPHPLAAARGLASCCLDAAP
jgi:hypothetical protein